MARKVTTADLAQDIADKMNAALVKAAREKHSGRLLNEGQKKQPDGHRAKARLVAE